MATDTADPVFYSTVIMVQKAGGFVNLPPYKYAPPTWNQDESCLTCAFQQSVQTTPVKSIVDWTKGIMPATQACLNCDLRNSPLSMAALPLSGANQPNAGAPPAASTTYSWISTAFSACACDGTQTRGVSCQNSAGVAAPDSSCTTTKPSTSQACTAPSTCFQWQQGSWSACSNDCGTGAATATVTCVQSATGPTPGATASAESLCTAAKPATSQVCNSQACPVVWKEGGFGPCSVACGGGTQTQIVSCLQTQNGAHSVVADALCAAAVPKPATSKTCNTAVSQREI